MVDDSITLASLQSLLSVQACDSELALLNGARAHTPAQQAMDEVARSASILRPQLTEATNMRNAVRERLAKVDAEASAARNRIDEINMRLFGSSSHVGPNDALKMSQEIDHLKVRVNALEDEELAIMESLEPLEQKSDELESLAVRLRDALSRARSDHEVQIRDIEAKIAVLRDRRNTIVQTVPASLLALYEHEREGRSTPLVALVEGRNCGGCHLALSSVERDALHKLPESELIRCGECSCILVRTE